MREKMNRLDKYMKLKGLNDNQVTAQCGLSQGLIGQARADKSDLGAKTIEKILNTYQDLSRVWLLTGTGQMLTDSDAVEPQPTEPDMPRISHTSGRPYFNVDFVGGFDLVLNDQTIHPEYYIDFAPFNKPGVMWCNITGHSMEPLISHGDMMAIREVADWQQFLTMGEVYAIVTANDLRTVKIIRKASDTAMFRLIPINTKDFDEQEIPKAMVAHVFEVLGCMKKI